MSEPLDDVEMLALERYDKGMSRLTYSGVAELILADAGDKTSTQGRYTVLTVGRALNGLRAHILALEARIAELESKAGALADSIDELVCMVAKQDYYNDEIIQRALRRVAEWRAQKQEHSNEH